MKTYLDHGGIRNVSKVEESPILSGLAFIGLIGVVILWLIALS